MRSARLAAAAVVALVLAASSAGRAQSPSFSHAAAAVSGRVVDAVTGRPVPGAWVLVYWPGARAAPPFFFDTLAVREAVTDAQGRFTIAPWRSDALASPPGDAEPRLWAVAPGYRVASVAVGWGEGAALRVPLEFPRAPDVLGKDLMFYAASLGFLAASLDGDPPLALVDALDREWRRLPAAAQQGQTSVRPMFEHARNEGRALIAEWRSRPPEGPRR